MRIFLSVLVLIFSLQSWTKADDIRDFEIEGMGIGDSLLDIATEIQINKAKDYTQFPNDKFIITTNTPSAKSIISEKNNLHHQYLPIDWLYSISKFIKNTKPKICILIETELWPNLISSCKKRHIPILIANARLSKKTTNSPEFIRNIYKKALNKIDLILCKSKIEKDNYIKLGSTDKNIKIMGNLMGQMSSEMKPILLLLLITPLE